MGIYDFDTLTKNEQADLVWQEGVFLMSRSEVGINYALFHVGGIYVEFHYDIAANKIIRLKTFTDPGLLDPYFAG